MEKRKLEADKKLIKVLFDLEPMDWCRLDNGNLIYLNQAGQKFTLTPEEIATLSDKKLSDSEASRRDKEKSINKPIPKGYKSAKGVLNNGNQTSPEDLVKKAREPRHFPNSIQNSKPEEVFPGE